MKSIINNLKIALVYDQLTKWGGAEELISLLLSLLPPQTKIFTPKLKKGILQSKKNQFITSFLSYFPFNFIPYQLHLDLSQLVIENFDFSNYDLVISIGNTLAKGIITNTKTKHLYYAFTANRFLWQDYQLFKHSLPFYLRPFFINWAHNLRKWDYLATQRPDKIITISSYSKSLIEKYYHRPAEIVYPPFNLNYWLKLTPQKVQLPFKNFFLNVNRLVPQKRTIIAIRAALATKTNLVIVGKGWLKTQLQKTAKNQKNILFLENLTPNQLKYLYQSATALLQPQIEDFGYVFLEAGLFYTPIIAFNKGGQVEILSSYPLANFFSNQENLKDILFSFKKQPRLHTHWPSSNKMKHFYQPFNRETFQVKLRRLINQLIRKDNL